MIGRLIIAIFVALLVGAASTQCAQAGPLDETRYCGAPPRTATGAIKRRADVLAAFQQAHPCPATGLAKGACPGWAKDHIVPIACGGCDAVSNLQWMPDALKSAAGAAPKDRWERKVYASTPPQTDTAACVNQVVP